MAILAWVALAVSVYLISTRAPPEEVVRYNPYDILGISDVRLLSWLLSSFVSLILFPFLPICLPR